MTVLGALAGRETPRNTIQHTPWGDWSDASGSTWAGVNVTNETALQLLTVYGCVQFIANGIATLPVDVLRKGSDGSPEPAPKPRWVEFPTPELDFTAWTTQVLTSLLLDGNAYCFKGYDSRRELASLTPLDPATVKVERRASGRRVFRVGDAELSSADILHIPGVMYPGADVGLSPVEAARQSLGVGMSAQEYAARFFGDDSTPPGVIELPGEADPGMAREMARAWAKAHSGKSNRKLPGVLQGGAQWKPTAVTNEQAQFLQTRKFTAAEIAANMFLIDPSEMGIGVEGQSLTYANLEQRNARKVQVTFLPWIVRLERALTDLMARPRYLKLNVSGLLRGDQATRFQSYAIAIENEFMVPNEARAFEDWSPLPGGDRTVSPSTPQETQS